MTFGKILSWLADGTASAVLPGLAVLALVAGLAWRRPRSRKSRRRAERIGSEGERRVDAVLREAGVPFLRDCHLPLGRGFTQIDHLVNLGSRIVVVECKAMGGIVSGNARSHRWSRELRGRHLGFPNPIRQNELHVLAVRRLVGNVPLESLVVMTSHPRFRTGYPDGVTTLEGLRRAASTTGSPRRDVERAWRSLEDEARRNDSDDVRRRHLRSVVSRHG